MDEMTIKLELKSINTKPLSVKVDNRRDTHIRLQYKPLYLKLLSAIFKNSK